MALLSSVIEVTRGVITSRFKSSPTRGQESLEVGLYQIADLQDLDAADPKETVVVPEKDIQPYLIRGRTVLIALVGAPLRAAVARHSRPTVAGSNLAVARPIGIDADFLTIVLRSQGVTRQVERRLTGTTVAHLSLDALRQLEIPLPSLDEQRAIAHAMHNQHLLERRILEYLECERTLASARLEYLLQRSAAGKEDQ